MIQSFVINPCVVNNDCQETDRQKDFTTLTDEQWTVIQSLMDWEPSLERGKSRAKWTCLLIEVSMLLGRQRINGFYNGNTSDFLIEF